METRHYQKMAGTSAVFLATDYRNASPVERDGLVWDDEELHLPKHPAKLNWQMPMDSVLALEGLEEYDPPTDGDVRFVYKLGIALVYVANSRAWVALTHYA